MELADTAGGAEGSAESEDGELMQSGFAMPIDGPLTLHKRTQVLVRHRRVEVQQQPVPKELKGCISFQNPYDQMGNQVDKLLEMALDRDARSKPLDMAVRHYRKKTQVVIAETKDAVDYMIPYRGFGPSAEAGNIILGEKLKVKSRASAEYARQKLIDETHLKVTTSMFQLAMGLGTKDSERGEQIIASGMKSLTELVGEEEAKATFAMFSKWKDTEIPAETLAKGQWDVAQKQDKHKLVVAASLEEDPVVREIKKRVHKYSQKSKFSMVTSQVVQTTLGVAALTPSFIGPAAKIALLTFVMATGGPESCKLLKELYLDKRFESRLNVISEEAHMALDNYQLAILTRNPVLLACSESMLGQMIGEVALKDVMGATQIAAKKSSDS